MVRYKVEQATNADNAEEIMNQLARKGWRVISTTSWVNFRSYIIITFEREIS